MVELLSKIENCTNKVEKYNLVIEYMEQEGISFKPAQNDHINNQYRVLSNKSSVFVYTNSFKFNLCEEDKKRLENKVNLAFEPLYSNKKQLIVDKSRPWTCSFSDIETFKNVVTIISGKEITGINVPRKPVNVIGDTVTCPNCSGEFKKAERCPDCGQKIDYSSSNNLLKQEFVDWSLDIESILQQICRIVAPIVAESDYSIERNQTQNEKSVDIFKAGNSRRYAHIWPKVRSNTVIMYIPTDLAEVIDKKLAISTENKETTRSDNYVKYVNLSIDTLVNIVKIMCDVSV